MKFRSAAMALALLTPALALGAGYDVDPVHSTVGFSVKHMMVSTVHGKFTKFTGTLEVDDQNPANDKLSVDIDANSIDTGNEKRDGHLKTADFLDTAKFPKITYVSKSVKSLGPGKLEVKGDLTLHGVTKPVVLTVSDLSPDTVNPMDKLAHRGASATGVINRQDFGVKWNAPVSGKAGDVMLSDEVKLSIDVEMVKKKPAN
jgi:polyisoprenoid-binding protein YceI